MDFSNSSATNSTSNTFYVGLAQWDFLKVLYLVFHILLTFIAPGLLYSVVWYERFSSDIRCRTLINQLLAHICIFSIIDCLINRTLYLSIIFTGPYSSTVCGYVSLMGRFCYLIRITELSIRQLVIYFYIFQWNYLVSLNNDFYSIFFTLWNLLLCFLFILTTYQLGFQDSELDYHICTGKQPTKNIMETFLKMNKFVKSNELPPTYYTVIAKDPLNIFTQIVFLMLVLIAIHTWANNKKDLLINKWKNIRCIGNNTIQDNIIETKTKDAENALLGVGGALILIVLIVLVYIPTSICRYIVGIDPDSINYGTGRFWNYISRFSIPIIHYCIFPMIILGTNSKMRKTLKREIKDFMSD
jgi:hypothetical protein